MKSLFMIAILVFASFSAAFAGGGTVGPDQNDSNLEREGNRVTVKRTACLAYGGHVTDDDKRYFMCADGKYDGYITAGPAVGPSCNVLVGAAKDLVEQDGTVADEAQFVQATANALTACLSGAKNWASLKQAIQSAKKSCDESANQGQSDLYRGTCYLKAAELATFVLGQ